MINHKGSLRLETDRIILRPFEEGDAPDIYLNWASDDEVTKHLCWPTHRDLKVSERVLETWISSNDNPEIYQWAIFLKEINQVIGSLSLMNIDNQIGGCEVGYCIGRPWWNKGIVTEALKEVIRFGFCEVGFERIAAHHYVLNEASGQVMKKCGMQYEGTLRKILKNGRGEIVDCRYYSILKEEYICPANGQESRK